MTITQARKVLGVTVMLMSDTLVLTVNSEFIPANTTQWGKAEEKKRRKGRTNQDAGKKEKKPTGQNGPRDLQLSWGRGGRSRCNGWGEPNR